jgi:predicted RNA-binding protein associated with RNAse of E/G family
MNVNIHYRRLSARGTTIFREGFVADDGQRLTTYTELTTQERLGLSQAFWDNTMLPHGYLVSSIRKHYFYNEYFDILAIFNPAGELASYYCDIATPLRKIGDDYYLDDLFLDYWLAPGQPPRALDLDEFEAGVAQGLMAEQQVTRARETFSRLGSEIGAGIFPSRYIGN